MRLISQAVLVLSFFLNGSARDQFIKEREGGCNSEPGIQYWKEVERFSPLHLGQEMSFPATLPLVVEKRE